MVGILARLLISFSENSGHLPSLNTSECNTLLQPLFPQEIKDALFSLAEEKSPGLDGYNDESCKAYWSTVGIFITTAVQHFFTTSHLLKEWYRTLLIHIPKVNPP